MSKQAHEKMFNIWDYQRNANQNHSEVLPHSGQMASSKYLQMINAGKDVKKREPSYAIGGNVNWYSHCGKMVWSYERLTGVAGIWHRIG